MLRSARFLATALVGGLGVLLITMVRGSLAETFDGLKIKNDVYPLPPVQQTVLLSLGYRAALADVIFAHLLVSQGLHFQEKRRFEFVGSYLETINELDPKFRSPYMIADTLLTMQPVPPPLSYYIKARAILERGMKELPFDSELHINAGQYLLYLGINAIKDPEEQAEWKRAGTRAFARACEVLGNQKNLPFHCIHAAAMLEKEGKREAMLAFVHKMLTVDDPEIREKALAYLAFAEGQAARQKAEARFSALAKEHAEDAPFLSGDLYGLLPPRFETLACTGMSNSLQPRCATSWRDRTEELASAQR